MSDLAVVVLGIVLVVALVLGRSFRIRFPGGSIESGESPPRPSP
jgi:hypothetical protein